MGQIKDASGGCYGAKVDITNKLHTQALTINNEDNAVLEGDSFGLLSGIITLTGDTQRDLVYFKNDGSEDLLLDTVTWIMGTPVGNSGSDWKSVITVAPTGGSLLSATETAGINNNLGSPKTLEITAFAGDSTTTVSGGIPLMQLIPGPFGTYNFTQLVVIPQGFSLSVGAVPPSGTTSVDISIGMTLIKQTNDFS